MFACNHRRPLKKGKRDFRRNLKMTRSQKPTRQETVNRRIPAPIPCRGATPHAPAANRPPAGQARNAAAERERPPACRGTVGRADPPLGITRAARTRKPTGTRLIQAEPEPSRAALGSTCTAPRLGLPPSRHRQATATPHLRVDDDPFARSFLPSFLARSSAAKRNPLPPPPSHHHSRTAATVPRLTEAT